MSEHVELPKRCGQPANGTFSVRLIGDRLDAANVQCAELAGHRGPNRLVVEWDRT